MASFLIARTGVWRGRSVLMATGVYGSLRPADGRSAAGGASRGVDRLDVFCPFGGVRPLGFNSLAAAALVVLAWIPRSLFFAGTQLSFLAVAVMIHFRRLDRAAAIHDPSTK